MVSLHAGYHRLRQDIDASHPRNSLRPPPVDFLRLHKTGRYWGLASLGSFWIRYAAHHGLAMIFLRDSFCLSAVSLLRQWHYILDFSCCSLSRVLRVALANLQKPGFEFLRHHLHLMDDRTASRLLHYWLNCADETQQGWNSCPIAILGFQFGLYHVVVPLSFPSSNQPWIIVTSQRVLGYEGTEHALVTEFWRESDFIGLTVPGRPWLKRVKWHR